LSPTLQCRLCVYKCIVKDVRKITERESNWPQYNMTNPSTTLSSLSSDTECREVVRKLFTNRQKQISLRDQIERVCHKSLSTDVFVKGSTAGKHVQRSTDFTVEIPPPPFILSFQFQLHGLLLKNMTRNLKQQMHTRKFK
jgi:hypothetical protein